MAWLYNKSLHYLVLEFTHSLVQVHKDEDTVQTECWTWGSWAAVTDQPAEPSPELVHSTGRPAKPGQTESGRDDHNRHN